jgi:hypothetical protein
MIKKLYNNKIYNNKIYYKIMDQISDKFFYLPCEITHYTFRKYFSIVRDRFPGVKQVIDLIGPPDESKLGGIGYYQDAYVQLFNGTEYKNLINLCVVDSAHVKKVIYTCIADRCDVIFTKFDRLWHSYSRGETFTIEPGKSIVPEGSYTQHTIIEIIPDFENDNFIEISIPKVKSYNIECEQSKGGNFIASPNGTIFYVEGAHPIIINELLKSMCCLVEIKCGFKAVNNTFRHIDELMCFMPYGDRYKVWFYDELDRNCFRNLLDKETIDEKIRQLNIERILNLNIISNALFKKDYDECIDNFVFFKFYSFLPSIFNRTWYETPDKCICLFASGIEANLLIKLRHEMSMVRSIINPQIEIEYDFIDVRSPNELNPEGTLHCLIKQRFIKPGK